MKKATSLIMFLLFATVANSFGKNELEGEISKSVTVTQSPESRELSVLFWNIWHGRGQGHDADYRYKEKGCDGILSILKASEADVIITTETYGAAPSIAQALGYGYKEISNGLAAYSRYPITALLTFEDHIGAGYFGGVEIDVEGKKIRVFGTHISARPDCTNMTAIIEGKDIEELTVEEILAHFAKGSRENEIKAILSAIESQLAEVDNVPIIITGDFNSHSHLDWTEATKNLYNHGGKVVDWPISKSMEVAGFKDSFREMNSDPVKNYGVTWLYLPGGDDREEWFNLGREDRIDYIYYQGDGIKAVASETQNAELGTYLNFRGEDLFFGSDHGFVLTTFEIR